MLGCKEEDMKTLFIIIIALKCAASESYAFNGISVLFPDVPMVSKSDNPIDPRFPVTTAALQSGSTLYHVSSFQIQGDQRIDIAKIIADAMPGRERGLWSNKYDYGIAGTANGQQYGIQVMQINGWIHKIAIYSNDDPIPLMNPYNPFWQPATPEKAAQQGDAPEQATNADPASRTPSAPAR